MGAAVLTAVGPELLARYRTAAQGLPVVAALDPKSAIVGTAVAAEIAPILPELANVTSVRPAEGALAIDPVAPVPVAPPVGPAVAVVHIKAAARIIEAVVPAP